MVVAALGPIPNYKSQAADNQLPIPHFTIAAQKTR